jgi:[ribosomal protein S18]-alanine N-acetyltransferase
MAQRDVVIRPMRRDDLGEVIALDHQCFAVPWSENAFAAEVHNVSACYLVAEARGRICGYLGAWIIMDEVHVTTLGVDPELRRHGIGERLLATMMKEALARGARRASLEVRPSNQAALNLYAKYGFQPVSRRPHYYTDNGEDALVLWIEDMAEPRQRQLLETRFSALEARRD